jgi:hypothetical protein
MRDLVLYFLLAGAGAAASTHIAQAVSPAGNAPRLRVVSAHCIGCLVLGVIFAWWVL